MIKYLGLFISMLSVNALAAGGGGHHDIHYIPWNELIIPQIVNVSIFLSILFLLLRKPIKNHFAGKVESFEQAKQEAQKAKKDAEDTHAEVTARLQELESTTQQNMKTAHAEAEALKLKIIDEAKTQAERMEKEAERSAHHELQKALFKLRTELLNQSIDVAETELQTKTTDQVDQQLQSAFVQKAQGVRI